MNLIESDYLPFTPGELPPGPWLVLAPHPDDETYGMGGSIRRATRIGIPVQLIVLTDGALGGPDPATLVPRREQETSAAAAILGIDHVEFWRQPDRGLGPSEALIQRLAERLRGMASGTLFIPSLTEPHPDHRATAVIGWEACRLASFPLQVVAYEISSQGPINLLLDISDEVDAKQAAMDIYTSQEAERPYARRVLANNIARTWSLADTVRYVEAFLHHDPQDQPLVAIAEPYFARYLLGLTPAGSTTPPHQIVTQRAFAPPSTDAQTQVEPNPQEAVAAAPSFSLPGKESPVAAFTAPTASTPVSLLLFHPSDTFGGAERITKSLVQLHDPAKIRIVLVGSPPMFLDEQGDRFISLHDLGLSNGFSTLRRALADARTLVSVARKHECHVALGMLHYGALVVALMRVLSLFRIKAISSPRTPSVLGIQFHVGRSGLQAFKWRSLVGFFCRFANLVLVASEGLKGECVRVFGSSPHRVKVIPNGIDAERLRELATTQPVPSALCGRYRIATFGRLAPEKDLDTLFHALAIVRRELDVTLSLVGDGPERERLQQLAHELGIAASIEFHGFHVNPFGFVKGSDVFVHTSRFEGFGNVILEAMACALPVIATDCDFGPREIIQQGENGMLVPIGDTLQLSQCILRLCQDSPMRQKLIKKGMETVKLYSVTKMVQSYQDIITSVMKNPA
jgi:glycosyltransferase involved in cell wall biosynthesis/LmbE family N-acetylglucosaminyl deacetylase